MGSKYAWDSYSGPGVVGKSRQAIGEIHRSKFATTPQDELLDA